MQAAAPRRALGMAVPTALSLAVWAAGSAAVLRHVLLADDFVSAEIRRHGLVSQLLATLAAFAVPYLAIGLVAAWTARGLVRLAMRRPAPLGAREAWVGAGIVGASLGAAGLFALVERPANFAGIFWQRGGAFREVHRTAEALATPEGVAWVAGLAGTVLLAAASAGWWRHAKAGSRKASVVTAAVALAALASASLARRPERAVDPARPNILVLVVDSLRPDRVDGSARALRTAPRLASLFHSAVRFTDARTPCALTYPAIASLLTGLHPAHHGIRHLYPEHAARELADRSLARHLEQQGWATTAVGGYCATPLRELAFGFGSQRTPRSEVDLIVSAVALRGHPWLPAVLRRPWMRTVWPQMRTAIEGANPADLADEAVAAWARLPEPFFEIVFFDNPHLPYVPAWPDSLRDPTYDGPNRYTLLSGGLVEQVREGEAATVPRGSDVERENAVDLYDGAVRSVDRAIGRILDGLREDGLAEQTIVLLLADHGENLLDDGGPLGHGEAMERDGSTHIPWWIVWPGRLEPRAVTDPVLLTDVAPTILDLIGLPPMSGVDGVSRSAQARGRAGPPERPALFETGMWFFAREAVDRLDETGRALAYPSFIEGLLTMEPGDPPHVVVAEAYREAVVRAKHRRLEHGPWALTYIPRDDGASFRLFRRDLDPAFRRDLSEVEPEMRRAMIARFYEEARRLGESEVLPESVLRDRFFSRAAPNPTISAPASEIQAPTRRGSVSVKTNSMSVVPAGTGTTMRP